jgi:hypothetical protein
LHIGHIQQCGNINVDHKMAQALPTTRQVAMAAQSSSGRHQRGQASQPLLALRLDD